MFLKISIIIYPPKKLVPTLSTSHPNERLPRLPFFNYIPFAQYELETVRSLAIKCKTKIGDLKVTRSRREKFLRFYYITVDLSMSNAQSHFGRICTILQLPPRENHAYL
jgi:hypothetical protein